MYSKLLRSSAIASAVLALGGMSSTAILGIAKAQNSDQAATHAAKHHRHHRRQHHRARHHGIPQHNGGDRDSDNNGGPSDGDGNV